MLFIFDSFYSYKIDTCAIKFLRSVARGQDIFFENSTSGTQGMDQDFFESGACAIQQWYNQLWLFYWPWCIATTIHNLKLIEYIGFHEKKRLWLISSNVRNPKIANYFCCCSCWLVSSLSFQVGSFHWNDLK